MNSVQYEGGKVQSLMNTSHSRFDYKMFVTGFAHFVAWI